MCIFADELQECILKRYSPPKTAHRNNDVSRIITITKVTSCFAITEESADRVTCFLCTGRLRIVEKKIPIFLFYVILRRLKFLMTG